MAYTGPVELIAMGCLIGSCGNTKSVEIIDSDFGWGGRCDGCQGVGV